MDTAVGVDVATRTAVVYEVIEVRDGFAHGKHHLMGIEFAFKQDVQQFGSLARLREGCQKDVATFGMMICELLHARANASKRLTVGW